MLGAPKMVTAGAKKHARIVRRRASRSLLLKDRRHRRHAARVLVFWAVGLGLSCAVAYTTMVALTSRPEVVRFDENTSR
jgi:hypothetical protein